MHTNQTNKMTFQQIKTAILAEEVMEAECGYLWEDILEYKAIAERRDRKQKFEYDDTRAGTVVEQLEWFLLDMGLHAGTDESRTVAKCVQNVSDAFNSESDTTESLHKDINAILRLLVCGTEPSQLQPFSFPADASATWVFKKNIVTEPKPQTLASEIPRMIARGKDPDDAESLSQAEKNISRLFTDWGQRPASSWSRVRDRVRPEPDRNHLLEEIIEVSDDQLYDALQASPMFEKIIDPNQSGYTLTITNRHPVSEGEVRCSELTLRDADHKGVGWRNAPLLKLRIYRATSYLSSVANLEALDDPVDLMAEWGYKEPHPALGPMWLGDGTTVCKPNGHALSDDELSHVAYQLLQVVLQCTFAEYSPQVCFREKGVLRGIKPSQVTFLAAV